MKTLQTLLSSHQKHKDSQMYRSWCLLVINTSRLLSGLSKSTSRNPAVRDESICAVWDECDQYPNVRFWLWCQKKKKKKEGKFKVSHLQISQTKITRTSWLSFSRYFPPLIGSEWLKKTQRVTTRFITGESFIGLSHFWTPNKIHKLTPLRMLLSAELPRDKVQTPTRVFVKEGERQRLSLPLTYDVQAGERSADRTCL